MAEERSYKGTVQASEILAKIENGEVVKYDDVIIKGDLHLPLAIVNAPITISNSIVQGEVNFEDTIFLSAIDFRGTIFADDVYFCRSDFKSQCIFEGAHFQKTTYFSRMAITGLKNAHFRGPTNFKRMVFGVHAGFSEIVFECSAEFSSQIPKESINSKSVFKGNAQFK